MKDTTSRSGTTSFTRTCRGRAKGGSTRRRGYPPDQLEKILGGNVLRVLEANERGVAALPQARAERSEGCTVSDIK